MKYKNMLTRNLGRSAPLFLAPAVGCEPYGLPALSVPFGMRWAAGGPLGPQQYSMSKKNGRKINGNVVLTNFSHQSTQNWMKWRDLPKKH